MIRSHLYAMKEETPVYNQPSGAGDPVFMLGRGNWVGVLEHHGEWIQVIGIYFRGWVRAEDFEERDPLSLHAQWSPEKALVYVSQAI